MGMERNRLQQGTPVRVWGGQCTGGFVQKPAGSQEQGVVPSGKFTVVLV